MLKMITLLTCFSACLCIFAQDAGTLSVISKRPLNSDERRARVPDYFGETVAVTLRYESPYKSGVYLYEPKANAPAGYLVIRKRDVVLWKAMDSAVESTSSPGFKALESKLGPGWIYLPPHSALEWEFLTNSRVENEEIAKTVFVRKGKTKPPIELRSAWYR